MPISTSLSSSPFGPILQSSTWTTSGITETLSPVSLKFARSPACASAVSLAWGWKELHVVVEEVAGRGSGIGLCLGSAEATRRTLCEGGDMLRTVAMEACLPGWRGFAVLKTIR